MFFNEPIGHINIGRMYLKELTHRITEASKSKICRVSWQSRDLGKSWCCSSNLKTVCWQNFFLFTGDQSSSIKAFNWLDGPLSHIMERNLLYSKSTLLNVSLIPNHSIKTSRIIFNQISRYRGPAKLIHKINHHNFLPFLIGLEGLTLSQLSCQPSVPPKDSG